MNRLQRHDLLGGSDRTEIELVAFIIVTEELPRQEAYSQLDPTNQTIMLITTEAGANNKYLRKKVLFLVYFFIIPF